MTDAPKRINLIKANGMVSDYWRGNYTASEETGVEYLRADIVDDLLEALETIAHIPNSEAAQGIMKVYALAAIAKATE